MISTLRRSSIFPAILLSMIFIWQPLTALASDVYFIAVGSSFYISAAAGAHGLQSINGGNKSARMMAERLARGGAKYGILLTSDEGAYVGLSDITSAIGAVVTHARSDRPPAPLLVFYFAGHGISEGIAWSYFGLPGNFTYRGSPEELPISGLAATTLSAGNLADEFDKTHMPYLIMLDTCYEGREARFDSPVLSGVAIDNLREVGGILRYVNEFHQSNPVVFSTAPGMVANSVEDPTDPGADKVAPLARRSMLIFDRTRAAGQVLTLGDFLRSLKDPNLDKATGPGVSKAEAAPTWQSALVTPNAKPGQFDRRLGTAKLTAPCCEAERGPASRSMHGTMSLAGGRDDFVSGGRTIELKSPTMRFQVTQDGPGDLTVRVGRDGAADWEISLATAANRPFQKLNYREAQRYPFNSPNGPSMSVSGNGRGCNELHGDFQIEDVQYDHAGQITRFIATLHQFCEHGATPLSGRLELELAN